MLSGLEQNKIVKQVTQEILNEIKNSDKTFSNEEIKERIDKRIKEIVSEQKMKQNQAIQKEEEKKEKEFIEIEEVFDEKKEDKFADKIVKRESNKNDSFKRFRANYVGEFDESKAEDKNDSESEPETTGDKNQVYATNYTNVKDTKEDKKFFREISEIYKDELAKSKDCFRNAFESLKLIKNSSILEKFLIFLFLSIPAILGGILTIIFILILLIFWQIFIIFNVLVKFLKKIETKIDSSIKKIKNKIEVLKNSGGLFNRLVFSNLLYSIMILNGAMYIVIKGVMLPLRSALEIDKILANFMSKSVGILAIGLKGPSELALNNLHTSSAFRNGTNKAKTKEKTGAKLELKEHTKNLQKQRDKTKDAAQYVDKVKVLEHVKEKEHLKDIEKKHNLDKISEKVINSPTIDSNTKELSDTKKTQEELIGKSNFLSSPSSSMLSGQGREGLNIENMSNGILSDVAEAFFSGLFGGDTNRANDTANATHGDKRDGKLSDVQKDINKEIGENTNQLNQAREEIQNNGLNPDQMKELYEQLGGGQQGMDAVMKEFDNVNPDATPEQKRDFANTFGEMRNAEEEIQDLHNLNNTQLPETMQEYLPQKVQDAKEGLQQEAIEFGERHNGKDPNELIQNLGLNPSSNLTDEQLADIANQFPEGEQVAVVKDLREYNLAYIDLQEARDQQAEYNARETGKSEERHTSHTERYESSRNQGRDSDSMGIDNL